MADVVEGLVREKEVVVAQASDATKRVSELESRVCELERRKDDLERGLEGSSSRFERLRAVDSS